MVVYFFFFGYGMLFLKNNDNLFRIYAISNIEKQIHKIKLMFKFYLVLNFLLKIKRMISKSIYSVIYR